LRAAKLSLVIAATAALAGVSVRRMTGEQRSQLVVHISEATRQCWEYFPWWQTELVEKRYYAAAFDPTKDDYVTGDLVRVVTGADTDEEVVTYYRALYDGAGAVDDLPQLEQTESTGITASLTISAATYAGTDAGVVFYCNFYKNVGTDSLSISFYANSGRTQLVATYSIDSLPASAAIDLSTLTPNFSHMGDLTNFTCTIGAIAGQPDDTIVPFVITRTVLAIAWEETTDFAAAVLLAQEGETVIGLVTEAHDADPINTECANSVEFRLLDDRVTFRPGAPVWVWLTFQRVPDPLDGTLFDTGEDVDVGEVRYDAADGNCYVCIQTVAAPFTDLPSVDAASESPSWRLARVPAHLVSAIKYFASAEYLREDGQEDKAIAREKRAYAELSQAIENTTMHARQAARMRGRVKR
jgi:hypothetical protein